MYTIYEVVNGPLVWISFAVFVLGSVYRLAAMAFLARRKDALVYAYFRPRYALRSLFHWLVPFGSRNMRKHPVTTLVAFLFHLSLLIVPIFLLAHVILWKENWDVSWWFLPGVVADALTLIVIVGCLFFLARRLLLPEVRYLTTFSDFLILFIVVAPFVTGFWSFHQWAGFRTMGILHVLFGEIMLVSIPFTKLSHMLFFPITRGYMGSEFGGIRQAKDW